MTTTNFETDHVPNIDGGRPVSVNTKTKSKAKSITSKRSTVAPTTDYLTILNDVKHTVKNRLDNNIKTYMEQCMDKCIELEVAKEIATLKKLEEDNAYKRLKIWKNVLYPIRR